MIAEGAFQRLSMGRRFMNELPFPQVEDSILFAVLVLDAEPEEPGQVEDEEKGEIGQHPAFAGVEVEEGIFDEIKKVGIGFGLLNAFL